MQFNLKHNSQLCSHKVLIVSYVLHCLLCVDHSVESCNVIVNGISSKVGDGFSYLHLHVSNQTLSNILSIQYVTCIFTILTRHNRGNLYNTMYCIILPDFSSVYNEFLGYLHAA